MHGYVLGFATSLATSPCDNARSPVKLSTTFSEFFANDDFEWCELDELAPGDLLKNKMFLLKMETKRIVQFGKYALLYFVNKKPFVVYQ